MRKLIDYELAPISGGFDWADPTIPEDYPSPIYFDSPGSVSSPGTPTTITNGPATTPQAPAPLTPIINPVKPSPRGRQLP
jgi:hypothetical protein